MSNCALRLLYLVAFWTKVLDGVGVPQRNVNGTDHTKLPLVLSSCKSFILEYLCLGTNLGLATTRFKQQRLEVMVAFEFVLEHIDFW